MTQAKKTERENEKAFSAQEKASESK